MPIVERQRKTICTPPSEGRNSARPSWFERETMEDLCGRAGTANVLLQLLHALYVCMSCMGVHRKERGKETLYPGHEMPCYSFLTLVMKDRNLRPTKWLGATSPVAPSHSGTSEAGNKTGHPWSAPRHVQKVGDKGPNSISLTLSRFTHVLDVGKRCSSSPASRIAKCGFNCLNPLCVPSLGSTTLWTGRAASMHAQQRRSTTTRDKPQKRPPLFLVEALHDLNTSGKETKNQLFLSTVQQRQDKERGDV